MGKFDPPPRELWFQLIFSLAGLALMGVALALRGLPEGPGLIEVVGFASAFFGGTAIWTILKLRKGRHD